MDSDEPPRSRSLDVRTWSRRRRFGLLALLGVLVAGGPLGTDMYTPGLPQVIDDLGTQTALVQLTLMAYNVGLGGGQFAWGPISDRIGRRVPVILGAAGFAFTALLCSLAPNIGVLLVGRVLMGFAGAAGIVVGRAIARDLYSGAELTRVFGLLAVVFGIAPVLGPLVGGLVLSVGDWRSTFLLLMTIGILLAIASAVGIPETLRPELRVRGASEERREAWLAPLRNRQFVTSVLILVGAATSMILYLSAVPIVLQRERGLDVLGFSVLYAINALAVIIGAQVGPWLTRYLGGIRVLVLALVVNLCAAVGVALSSAMDSPLWLLDACMWLTVFAGGICMPLAIALALQPFAKGAGTAAAIAGGAQLALGSVVPAIVVSVVATSGVVLGIAQAAVTVVTLGLVALAAISAPRGGGGPDLGDAEPDFTEPV
ncbi:multidrug effflux MFS transporter [Microbacterium sp. zg.B48]|uniref:multidrug effflux MFS transporter n=1 Tax=unclassified Microbacterium TaxID=2609290 RepID=UPI00214C2FA1|nr:MULTISPECIES: multidrug effflux MFS transporter [unclassified Microbacterium]MCR2764013.1 multidrug effflux MFS transporter [Microbacterium sp. zg.B48]MCR2810434.1 multidrug effflux MFS transporter [Microbacterium sp. zg.B185]WIM18486.1 multidrug effflux MFS transporter [Microbacterium sp. zg-B185]